MNSPNYSVGFCFQEEAESKATLSNLPSVKCMQGSSAQRKGTILALRRINCLSEHSVFQQ